MSAEIAAAARRYVAANNLDGWRTAIARAFADGAFGHPFEKPVPHPGTGGDRILNEEAQKAHRAGIDGKDG